MGPRFLPGGHVHPWLVPRPRVGLGLCREPPGTPALAGPHCPAQQLLCVGVRGHGSVGGIQNQEAE